MRIEYINNCLFNSMCNYPCAGIKQIAIGTGMGFVNLIIHGVVRDTCETIPTELKNYICLNPAIFLNTYNLEKFFRPVVDLTDLIGTNINYMLNMCISNFQIVASNYNEIVKLYLKTINTPVHSNINDIIDSPTYLQCFPINTNQTIADAFTEELIFRFVLQKTLLLALAKFLPSSLRKTLSVPTSRILITSFIFAFSHPNKQYVLPTLFGGILYGIIFEKYGIIASTTSHAVYNMLTSTHPIRSCENKNAEILTAFAKFR